MAEQNNNYGRPERIKNALDNRKLFLEAPCPGNPGKTSTLSWMLVANNPRMVVYTNDPTDNGADNGYGKITANLDAVVFMTFLESLTKMIDAPNDTKESIENRNYIFPGGKRSAEPVLVSTLYYGKDKDGLIWVSLVAKNRPKIKFIFGEGNFHHRINGDGSPADKSITSAIYANAYVKLMYSLMSQLLISLWVEPPKREMPNNNNGGGNGGNRQNSYKPEVTDSGDDDMPF